MSCAVKYIELGNSLSIEHYVSGISAETGKFEPAEDLDLSAFLANADDVDAAAIHGDLSVALTEGSATGVEQRYHGQIPGSAITEHLEEDAVVYLHIADAGGSYHKVYECKVVAETPEELPV